MSSKEKAEDIYQMMAFAIKGVYPNFDYEGAKQCSIIAANEAKKCTKYEKQTFEDDRFSEDYWTLVEQEINKL